MIHGSLKIRSHWTTARDLISADPFGSGEPPGSPTRPPCDEPNFPRIDPAAASSSPDPGHGMLCPSRGDHLFGDLTMIFVHQWIFKNGAIHEKWVVFFWMTSTHRQMPFKWMILGYTYILPNRSAHTDQQWTELDYLWRLSPFSDTPPSMSIGRSWRPSVWQRRCGCSLAASRAQRLSPLAFNGSHDTKPPPVLSERN